MTLRTYKKKIRQQRTRKVRGAAYEIAGKGTFGIVVVPALPNKNNNGANRNYPNNVTKIFGNANNYEKAFNKVNAIAQNIPSLNIPTHRYKRNYTFKNLPNSLKPKVRQFFTEQRYPLSDDTELLLLRTPYLGDSCQQIDTTNKYKELRRVPYKTLCKELYKCMKVVKAIHDAGYIHGDIRETNILCNLRSGQITIIDFDWLYPFEEFYEEYPTFFYPHPPECLFIWGRDSLYNYQFPDDEVRIFTDERKNTSVYKYVREPYDIYDSNIAGKAITEFRKSHRPSFSEGTEYGITEYSDDLFDIAKHFIDSYGLGHTYQILLKKAWYYEMNMNDELLEPNVSMMPEVAVDEADFAKFLNVRKFIFEELIPKLTHSDCEKRWRIDKALEEFEAVLMANGIQVEEYGAVAEEIERMKEVAAVSEPVVDASLPKLPPSPKSPEQSPKDIVKALEEIKEEAENGQNGGKRRRQRHSRRNKGTSKLKGTSKF